MLRIVAVAATVAVALMIAGGCLFCPKEKEEPDMRKELVVLCPNIFSDGMKEIKPRFEKANPGWRIKLDVYPVRPMLDDILKGKTGDIFLSPGDVELSHLAGKSLVGEGRDFAKMSLVAVTAGGNPLELGALKDLAGAKVKAISIPDPEFNSGGAALIEALKKIGIYETVKERLYFASGPKTATKYMEDGKADVAVTFIRCYHGHAAKNALIEFVPTALHDPIVSKAAVFKTSGNAEAAARFVEFIRTPESRALYGKKHYKD